MIWPKEVSLVKQNSILRSIVPLAMFYNYSIFSDPIFYFENCFSSFSQNIKFENIYYSNEIFSSYNEWIVSRAQVCTSQLVELTASLRQQARVKMKQAFQCKVLSAMCKMESAKCKMLSKGEQLPPAQLWDRAARAWQYLRVWTHQARFKFSCCHS